MTRGTLRVLLDPYLEEKLNEVREDYSERFNFKISKSKLVEIAISNFIEDYSSFIGLINYPNEFKAKLESIEELEELEELEKIEDK